MMASAADELEASPKMDGIAQSVFSVIQPRSFCGTQCFVDRRKPDKASLTYLCNSDYLVI